MAKTKLKPKSKPKKIIISRKKAVKAAAKAVPAKSNPKKTQGKGRIKSLGIENISKVQLHRQALLKKSESEKERREKTLFHKYLPQLVACIVALYIIIYFFAPPGWSSYMDVVFFSAFLVVALVLADFFYRHERKPHDVAIILGLFFLPPLFTAVIFFKFWAMVLLALMTWALISALIIHYEHKKGRNLTEVMWVSVYSHLLAFSAAIVLFALLSYMSPARFMSELAIILTCSLPPIFVHFFISQYMYVHHFDSKHPRKDFLDSIKHALWFTLIFFIVLSALDVGVNARSFKESSQYHADSAYFDLQTLSGISNSMDNAPAYLKELEVHKEVREYLAALQADTALYEHSLTQRRISLLDFMDDTYLDIESEMMNSEMELFLKIKTVSDAKKKLDSADPASAWERFSKEDVLAFYNADVSHPGYDAVRVALYSDRISPQMLDQQVLPAIDALIANDQQGIDQLQLSKVMSSLFLFGSSYFFERVNAVMQYSKLYLFTVRQSFSILVELPTQAYSPELWRILAENMDVEESLASKQLRYELLIMAGEAQQQYLNPVS